MATIIQGNREFGEIERADGSKFYYVFKVDGKHYSGKSFTYHKCEKCGQIICHMMGGAARHYKMCDKKTIINEKTT
jgi:ribosomal protein S27E